MSASTRTASVKTPGQTAKKAASKTSKREAPLADISHCSPEVQQFITAARAIRKALKGRPL